MTQPSMTVERAYNNLVRSLDRQLPVIREAERHLQSAGEDSPLLHYVDTDVSAATAVDSAPLYAMEQSAVDRAEALMKVSIGRGEFPTIPDGGCTVASARFAIFMRPIALSKTDYATIQSMVGPQMAGEGFCVEYLGWTASTTPGRETAVCGRLIIVRKPDAAKLGALTSSAGGVTYGGDKPSLVYCMVSSFDGVVSVVSWVDANGKLVKPTTPGEEDEKSWRIASAGLVQRGLAYLEYVDLPSHYVVEERPAGVPVDRTPRPKAARFHDRERWVTLTPEDVKAAFHDGQRSDLGGTHATPAPHLRRAHARTLRSDRYRFKQGTVVHVRPTWIGLREWGNKRMKYRVVSRAGASETQA